MESWKDSDMLILWEDTIKVKITRFIFLKARTSRFKS